MTKPMTQDDYATFHGDRCPWCHKLDIEIHRPYSTNMHGTTAKAHCRSCQATWNQDTILAGYSNLRITAEAAAGMTQEDK